MLSLTSGYTWIPLYLALVYLVIKNNETMAQIALAIGCVGVTVLVTDGIVDGLVKPAVARFRPVDDPVIKYTIDVVRNYRPDGYSFFSAHAANTMGIAVFICCMVRSRMLGIAMIIWSLINCWTRLYLGVHYPSDIGVGILCGAFIGILTYLLYRKFYFKISPKLHYISTQYTKTGYDYVDIDVVMTVLVLTLLVVIIHGIMMV